MNRINKIFENKRERLLSLYFCAGHPTLDSTPDIIETLYKNHIDFVEVGQSSRMLPPRLYAME